MSEEYKKAQTSFELIVVVSFILVILWSILLNVPNISSSTGAMIELKESTLTLLASQDKFYFIDEIKPPKLDTSVSPPVWKIVIIIGGEDIDADSALKTAIKNIGEQRIKEQGYYSNIEVVVQKALV